ncbi:MAG: M23 family metallopeptidase [Candidatus Binataceae bacterium]
MTRKLSFLGVLSVLLIGAFGAGSSAVAAEPVAAQNMTPLLLAIHDAPVPFMGSDGHIHLVYELWLTNFSSAEADIEQVKIMGDGKLLETMEKSAIEKKLIPAGTRQPSAEAKMDHSTEALLFIHVTLPIGAEAPQHLTNQVKARFVAAPPGRQEIVSPLDNSPVDRRAVVTIGPPLRGDHYISADSCCDASRHTQAALAANGRVWLAQRYAVDWEKLDDQNRIYVGPKEKVTSYKIYGQPVHAVADGTVVTAINDQPEQVPGHFPTAPTLEEADGNAVVEDIGGGNWAMYAHMQPGSLRVHRLEKIVRGQVIGLVGNSGNSLAPHLHFQVTNGPLPMASNGLPYEIDHYEITAISPGTEAFDTAESAGTPLALTQVSPPKKVTNALPLDQLIISFGH